MARRQPEATRFGTWLDRIHDREQALEQRFQEWRRYLRYYALEMNEDEMGKKGDTVWINYLFSFTRIIIPSIYYRNPDISVTPRKDTPREYAQLLEQLLNYQAEEMFFEEEMRKVCMDALQWGTGPMKFGHGEILRDAGKSPLDQLASFSDESLFDDSMWSEKPKPKSLPFEPNQLVDSIHPFAIRIPPDRFLIDPLATSLTDARWVVHCVLRTVDDVQKNKNYPRSLTSDIQGNVSLQDTAMANEEINPIRGRRPQDYQDLVMLYEIWDREENRLLLMDSWNMAQGENSFLRDDPNPYDMKGFPFEVLIFNPDPRGVLGISDYSQWINPTSAMNLLSTMQYTHVKRFNRKYVTPMGSMDPDEEAKFLSPEDGMVVHVKSPNAEGAIVPVMDAQITPDLYNLKGQLRADMVTLTGATEPRQGVDTGSKTATEASIQENQARVRDSDRLYLVSRFVERAFKKILSLDRQILTSTDVEHIVGPELLQLWQNDHERVLNAPVDVRVRVGSSAYVSREVKIKQMLDLLNLAGNAIDPSTQMPVLNTAVLIHRIAEEMGVDNVKDLFFQPPTPGPNQGMPMGTSPDMMAQPIQPIQAGALRTGATNLGNQLSGVQNLGVRRTPAVRPV